MCCSDGPISSQDGPLWAHLWSSPGIRWVDCVHKRAGTDGVLEGGSWKRPQPFEAKNENGKTKDPTNCGAEGEGVYWLSQEPREGHRGMAQFSTPLTYESTCPAEMFLFSFAFEGITETRELNHLDLQIMRIVIIGLAQEAFLKGEPELTSLPHFISQLGAQAPCAGEKPTFFLLRAKVSLLAVGTSHLISRLWSPCSLLTARVVQY